MKFGMTMSATKCVTSVGTAMVSLESLMYFSHCVMPSIKCVMSFFCALDYVTMDITKHAQDVVSIVEHASSMDEKLTPLKVCEAWMGKGPAKHRKMITITSLSRLEVESIIIHLLLHGYFRYLHTAQIACELHGRIVC